MKKLLPLVLATLASTTAFSQLYSQPWTTPLPSWDSNVRSCSAPVPFPRRCADDYVVPTGVAVTRLVWWGSVTTPASTQRQFHIAVYPDNGVGQPNWAVPLYQACVIPTMTFVGNDCNGRRVLLFTAQLPAGFPVGIRRWLSISQTATNNPTTAPDFWWSIHLPVTNAPAVQFDGAITTQPLVDVCSNQRDDLAFQLW